MASRGRLPHVLTGMILDNRREQEVVRGLSSPVHRVLFPAHDVLWMPVDVCLAVR